MFKKGNKGITLIALIITIIVLLILAGVTIAQITGQDSAPQKAAEAKLENEKGAAKDEATMLAAQYVQEYMEKKYVQNIRVETTSNVQDKKLEVGKDGNSIYKVSGVELPKMLADGEETIPAIVGDYVAQQFSSRANQEGSYNYSTTGRSLNIKTKSNEDLVSGTINDDGTITWDGSSSGGSETSGTTITVAGEEIALTAENAKDYYGTTVKIINGVEYGLFYIDFAGKYGDAGAVYLRAKSSVGNRRLNGTLSDADKSTAISIMKKLNPDWARTDARGNVEYSNYYDSEKGATYLCNPNNSMWSGIGSSFNSSELNYVVGAPSVEMFLDSYNAKYPNSSPKYTTAFRAAGQNYSYPGYVYSNNNGSSYANYYSEAIQTGDSTVGGMYRNSNYSEWLASPLSAAYDTTVCCVGLIGTLDYYGWPGSIGVAPLVSLKSGVHLVATVGKITVDGTDIDLGTLNAETVGQYYGRTVKTINGVEYGLFYVDYAGKYGDAGTVYLRAKSSIGYTDIDEYTLPSEGAGSNSSSSSEETFNSDPGIDPPSDAIEIMKQINPDWASNRGNNLSASEYLASERGAAYLCDEDNSMWSEIGSSFDSNYLNYVIGAPSIEMFLDSYNAKYPNSSPKYTTAFRNAGQNYEYPGYLYSNNNGSSYSDYYSYAIQEGDSTVGEMYRNPNAWEWLASPLSGDDDNYVCYVGYGGALNATGWDSSRGVAPLVSLKSGVDLTN